MARPQDYWDNRIRELSKEQGTEGEGAYLPAESPRSATGGQRELYERINGKKLRSDAEYWADQADRSWWSYLPYELQNSIYDMPEQRTWEEDYDTYQRGAHLIRENYKLVGNMIKNLPKAVARIPFKLGQTIYDTAVGTTAAVSPYKTREDIMKSLHHGETFNLPWLGEIRGFAGSYDEARELGLSPFVAGVSATGEVAGDIAATSVLGEGLTAATRSIVRPRIKRVKGSRSVIGKDFRPLSREKIAQMRLRVADNSATLTKAGKTAKQRVSIYGKAGQKSKASYFPVPKSEVAKYGIRTKNPVMIKVTPKGEGKAFYDIVEIRKSLSSKAKDLFRKKFGRSNVNDGPMGTELKLRSETISYDPFALSRKGSTAEAVARQGANLSEPAVPRAAERAKAATKGSAGMAVQFYSPNVGEDMTLDQARRQLTSQNQARYKKIGEDIDKSLGIKAKPSSAIGDWFDADKGAPYSENTVYNKITNDVDWDALRYSTALKGKIGNQKGVIAFKEIDGGSDALYRIDMRDAKGDISMEETRGILDKMGIENRTFVENKGGFDLMIFDPDRGLGQQIKKFLKEQGIEKIGYHRGKGDFIGGDTRADGMREYNKVIRSFENQHPDMVYQPPKIQRTPEKVAEQAKKIDPFIRDKQEPFYPMKRPIKGFESKPVTDEQVTKVIQLGKEVEIDDTTLQAVAKALTGKTNLYELTQNEAYGVSEAVRKFPEERAVKNDDFYKVNKSFTHPARYWMESAEREFGVPLYSEVYIPIETGFRLMRTFNDRWQTLAREKFGKYSKPKYGEERRAITDYIEGKKKSITENEAFSPQTKKDLIDRGKWLKSQYEILFKELGIGSDRFFSIYSPKIRKAGGIHNIYKSDELPAEIKPFFEFEREGMLDPIEDDALALFDIYTRAVGKKQFLSEPLENAKSVIKKSPKKISKATNSYIQEKIGFQDGSSEFFNVFSEKLSKATNGVVPNNLFKQMYDFAMTTSYAGALGLPRIMPIFRNSMQVLLTTYPEFGPEYFYKGMDRAMKDPAKTMAEIQKKGFDVKMGVPYGADLMSEAGQGVIGKAADYYKWFNRGTMKPYGAIDFNNRWLTYWMAKTRFEDYWGAYRDGEITVEEFEQGIDMDGFNPTLKNVLREKFIKNTDKSLEEAIDLMAMDILDRTQFPYRKGAESRMHYGVSGKMGLQFSQWIWEYTFTLKSWVSRGQWMKLIRWMGMGTAIKRSSEDTFGVDVTRWVNAPEDLLSGIFGGPNPADTGPFSGFPFGPIATMVKNAVESFGKYDEEVNRNWKDIFRTLNLYGGVPTGVGKQKWQKFLESVEKHDAGVVKSPYPDRPFGVWSSTGKIIRWVDFSDRLKVAFGFETPEGSEQSERITRIKRESTDYSENLNKAMDSLVRGDYEEFNNTVTKHNLRINDISSKLESYQIPLDQRIFERMPVELKLKYFNAFYPVGQE